MESIYLSTLFILSSITIIFCGCVGGIFLIKNWWCFITDQPFQLNQFEKWYAGLFVDEWMLCRYPTETFIWTIVISFLVSSVIFLFWPITFPIVIGCLITLALRQVIRKFNKKNSCKLL